MRAQRFQQGGRIIANGTAAAPIVFTSDQPVGQRARGDWGGLIINGEAPINTPGGIGLGEGDTGQFGGTSPEDNSGILRFVRVEFAGIEFSPENELNGIAFQGVGRGTIVDFVQVKANKGRRRRVLRRHCGRQAPGAHEHRRRQHRLDARLAGPHPVRRCPPAW